MDTLPKLRATDRIAVAYLGQISERRPDHVTVRGLCQESQVHRTSFYRHFRDLGDLDAKFLEIYFEKTIGYRFTKPIPVADLPGFYKNVVEAMQSQQGFFRGLYVHPWLLPYRGRWSALVAGWVDDGFGDLASGRPPLVHLLRHFGQGAIDRYLETALLGTSGYSLTELTSVLVSYLVSGATGVAAEEVRVNERRAAWGSLERTNE